jgi:hypothetical protein
MMSASKQVKLVETVQSLIAGILRGFPADMYSASPRTLGSKAACRLIVSVMADSSAITSKTLE